MAYAPSHRPPPKPIDANAALDDTLAWWRDWAGKFQCKTPWRDAVMRSLLTLKGLIYHPTGGMVAAATSSLPEMPGGGLNWDYRYAWLRDATFTLSALLNAGYKDEAACLARLDVAGDRRLAGENAHPVSRRWRPAHGRDRRSTGCRATKARPRCASATAPPAQRRSTSSASCWMR